MRRPWWPLLAPLIGLSVLLVAFWFGGDRDLPEIRGLPSPGPLTSWGLPVMRLLHDLCAVGTVGTLLAGLLLGATNRGSVRRWALAWAATAALTVVLTLSDFLGVPVGEALGSGSLPTFLIYVPQGLAFLIVYALTLTITLLLYTGVRSVSPLLGLAVLALLPPAYVGHSASAADHDLGVSSLVVHIVAATLWAGGVLGLLVSVRGAAEPGRAVRRFSALALGCFLAVAFSGTVSAWIRVGAVERLFTAYGLLVVAKVAALGALGWFGWWHRTRTIGALATTRAPFLRLAAGEVVLMAAAMGLAVALSRTPPPPDPSASHSDLGFDLAPFAVSRLLTEWRLDPLLLVGVAALAWWGRPRRPLPWAAGLVVIAYALVGGVGVYARALPSMQFLQYVLLGLVGPALLALGGPRLPRPPRAFVLAAYAVPYAAMAATPLLEWARDVLAVRVVVALWLPVAALFVFARQAAREPVGVVDGGLGTGGAVPLVDGDFGVRGAASPVREPAVVVD